MNFVDAALGRETIDLAFDEFMLWNEGFEKRDRTHLGLAVREALRQAEEGIDQTLRELLATSGG
jgi:hypothetical protein